MRTSNQGIADIANHEGIVPYPYRDSRGIWTCGVGHTASAGRPDPAKLPRGVEMPLSEVVSIFRRDLRRFEARVNSAVKVPLAQHEFDALVSFDFNTGGVHKAAITKHLNNGDRAAAAEAFMGWSKPPEIISRRRKEQALFRDGSYSSNGMAAAFTADAAGKVNWRAPKTVNVAAAMIPKPVPKPEAQPDPTPKPAPELADVLMVGSRGPRVKALQIELKRLNYHSGEIDEIYGNLTRDAVMAFQADNGLATDGMAGEKTWKALETAKPRPLMAKRTNATVEELAEKGSKIADGAVKSKKGAWAAIVGGVTTVGAKIADSAGDLVNLPLEPLRYAFETWGPWLFGSVIVAAGVFFLYQSRKVGDARLQDHRDAKTL